MVVLDKSKLLFWTFDRQRLSNAASGAISEADRVLVCSMSIWEIGIKVAGGMLSIPLPVRDHAERLGRLARVEITLVDTVVWLTNLELPRDHRDPADRSIVATAIVNSCPLVTSDIMIQAFYPRSVW